jgi:hypothetical protein
MTASEAAKLVAVMLVAFPSQAHRLSDSRQQTALAEVFADLLGDLSYEQCNAALRVLIQTRQFMPTVAEIRATAIDIMRGPQPSGADQWGNVLRAMRERGAYRTPGVDFVFNDPITAKCVQQMHWQTLCLSENSVADRARFIELYDKLASEARREVQAPLLAAAREQREQRQLAEGPTKTAVGALVALVARKGEP